MDAPPIQYAKTEDGVSIAYWAIGEGPPLVWLEGYYSHVELEWTIAPKRALYEALAKHWTLVRFDPRGVGASARVEEFTNEGVGRDLAAVAAALGLGPFTLFSKGPLSSAAIAYALEFPSDVPQLVFWNTTLEPETTNLFVRVFDAIRALDPALLQRTLLLWQGWEDGPTRQQMERLREKAVDPAFLDIITSGVDDRFLAIESRLDGLTQPVLSLGTEDSQFLLPAMRNRTARLFQNARLVTLPGSHGDPELGDHDRFIATLADFIPQPEARSAAPGDHAFRTILFTDVVASTPLLAQLKDARMREVMRDHDAVLQAAVDENGGRVVKEMGDAFMAEFAVPSSAVECAISMQRGIQAQFADTDVPIRLRIGINAGEPVAEDGDLHGASVVIAKRLESAAPENGILVSDVVKQMVMGKDFEFVDQGEVALKGFDEPVRAWSVAWA